MKALRSAFFAVAVAIAFSACAGGEEEAADNPCNPCAAAAEAPADSAANPCAENPCNPCNPCEGEGGQ